MKKEYILYIAFILLIIYLSKKMLKKNTSFDSLLFKVISEHEGFRPKMYFDTGGKPTIGFGTLIDTPEEQYLKTATITKEQGFKLMQKDLEPIIMYVNTLKGLTEKQKVSLCSIAYNIGMENFLSSTLLKKVKSNPNDKTIELEFLKWNKDQDPKTGKLVAVSGLTIRRQKESNLYFS